MTGTVVSSETQKNPIKRTALIEKTLGKAVNGGTLLEAADPTSYQEQLAKKLASAKETNNTTELQSIQKVLLDAQSELQIKKDKLKQDLKDLGAPEEPDEDAEEDYSITGRRADLARTDEALKIISDLLAEIPGPERESMINEMESILQSCQKRMTDLLTALKKETDEKTLSPSSTLLAANQQEFLRFMEIVVEFNKTEAAPKVAKYTEYNQDLESKTDVGKDKVAKELGALQTADGSTNISLKINGKDVSDMNIGEITAIVSDLTGVQRTQIPQTDVAGMQRILDNAVKFKKERKEHQDASAAKAKPEAAPAGNTPAKPEKPVSITALFGNDLVQQNILNEANINTKTQHIVEAIYDTTGDKLDDQDVEKILALIRFAKTTGIIGADELIIAGKDNKPEVKPKDPFATEALKKKGWPDKRAKEIKWLTQMVDTIKWRTKHDAAWREKMKDKLVLPEVQEETPADNKSVPPSPTPTAGNGPTPNNIKTPEPNKPITLEASWQTEAQKIIVDTMKKIYPGIVDAEIDTKLGAVDLLSELTECNKKLDLVIDNPHSRIQPDADGKHPEQFVLTVELAQLSYLKNVERNQNLTEVLAKKIQKYVQRIS